jgi:hypothetical protein
MVQKITTKPKAIIHILPPKGQVLDGLRQVKGPRW